MDPTDIENVEKNIQSTKIDILSPNYCLKLAD
jgi:hypothetical protein